MDKWRAVAHGSEHGRTAFLLARLLKNDRPSPSWAALRRLEAKYPLPTLTHPSPQVLNMNTPSHYSLEELLRRWKLDDITVEQTVGQLILNMQSLSKRIGSLEKERVAQAKPPQTAPK